MYQSNTQYATKTHDDDIHKCLELEGGKASNVKTVVLEKYVRFAWKRRECYSHTFI